MERFSTWTWCLSWSVVNFAQKPGHSDKIWSLEDPLEIEEGGYQLHPQSNSKERIIYTIIAVREYFIKTQVRYLKRLLDQDIITTVHIWDFCLSPSDRHNLALLQQEDHRIEVKQLVDKAGNKVSIWKDEDLKIIYPKYFEYYVEYLRLNDTLIKADDDIVYIENLQNLLTWFKDAPNVTVAFPQIINNDIMAYLQLKRSFLPRSPFAGLKPKTPDIWRGFDVLTIVNKLTRMEHTPHGRDYSNSPVTDWYRCTSCAQYAHQAFLADRSYFESNDIYLWSSPTRVSIDFFVMRGETVQKYFKEWEKGHIDESAITWRIQKDYQTTNAIYMNTVVVHYSYEAQLDMYPDFMDRYEILSSKNIF